MSSSVNCLCIFSVPQEEAPVKCLLLLPLMSMNWCTGASEHWLKVIVTASTLWSSLKSNLTLCLWHPMEVTPSTASFSTIRPMWHVQITSEERLLLLLTSQSLFLETGSKLMWSHSHRTCGTVFSSWRSLHLVTYEGLEWLQKGGNIGLNSMTVGHCQAHPHPCATRCVF